MCVCVSVDVAQRDEAELNRGRCVRARVRLAMGDVNTAGESVWRLKRAFLAFFYFGYK